MHESILLTKLYIPSSRPKLVYRKRLVDTLNEGLQRKLTLISAPAGFGKTTLMVEWLNDLRSASDKEPKCYVAWLSLDEDDNVLSRFLTYIIAAFNQIEELETAFGQNVLSMLRSPKLPPIESILTSLINEIANINKKIVLVLDDYHLIELAAIHDTIALLLKRLPPSLHLAILTREDPYFPLARIRARAQMTEIRAAELRFYSNEVTEFLNQTMGLNILHDDVSALEDHTEGWITGLQLAAISLQGQKDKSGLIQTITSSNRHLLDYLIEEILDKQPDSIKDFLLRTSTLSRLTGSLCDSLTDQNNSSVILETLYRSNIFIVPLDNEQKWYRYHHLFASLLYQRLQVAHGELVPILHHKASTWYEENDMIPDAVHHALTAKDYSRIAELAERSWPAWSMNNQPIAWLSWVQELPEDVVKIRPVLCCAYGQALSHMGNLEAAESRLQDAERCLELARESDQENLLQKIIIVDQEQFRSLPTTLVYSRAFLYQAHGDIPNSLKYNQQVLDLLPEEDLISRGQTTTLLGLLFWADGDMETAYQTFSKGLKTIEEATDEYSSISGSFILADMKIVLGRLHEAKIIYDRAIQLAAGHINPIQIGIAYVYTGISNLFRERGEFDEAAQALAASEALGDAFELPLWQYRWYIANARLQISLGNCEKALILLNKAENFNIRSPIPKVEPLSTLKAQVWIKQNKLRAVSKWVQKNGLTVYDEISYLQEFDYLTLARFLIAQYIDTPGDALENDNSFFQQALTILNRLLESAQAGKRVGCEIEILIQLALVYQVKGDIPAALIPLERALALAEPEGYSRIFIDEGPQIARLLYESVSREFSQDYIQQLLKGFSVDEYAQTAPQQQHVQNKTLLIESLSSREIDVLKLIAEGFTNQEIADRLYLSLNTIKVHTRNINSKLGVNSRTKAVLKAKTLGILESN